LAQWYAVAFVAMIVVVVRPSVVAAISSGILRGHPSFRCATAPATDVPLLRLLLMALPFLQAATPADKSRCSGPSPVLAVTAEVCSRALTASHPGGTSKWKSPAFWNNTFGSIASASWLTTQRLD
jgi:hypothetical protein